MVSQQVVDKILSMCQDEDEGWCFSHLTERTNEHGFVFPVLNFIRVEENSYDCHDVHTLQLTHIDGKWYDLWLNWRVLAEYSGTQADSHPELF